MSPDGRDDEIDELWQQAKATVLERCEVVRRAVASRSGTSDAVREAAHKMAGAIGMFGLRESSQLAQRLDALVVAGALDDERVTEVGALADELATAINDDR